MKVSAEYLDHKIKVLNEWLLENPKTNAFYSQKEQNRNFYVNKIIELDNSEAETINI